MAAKLSSGASRTSWIFKVMRAVPELRGGELRKQIEVPQPFMGMLFVS